MIASNVIVVLVPAGRRKPLPVPLMVIVSPDNKAEGWSNGSPTVTVREFPARTAFDLKSPDSISVAETVGEIHESNLSAPRKLVGAANAENTGGMIRPIRARSVDEPLSAFVLEAFDALFWLGL